MGECEAAGLAVVIPTTHRVASVEPLVAVVERTSPLRPVVCVVVDNGPSANLADWTLRSPHRVIVEQQYLGSERGFQAGVAEVRELCPTWTLLLDDDTLLEDNTLQMFLDAAVDPACVYSANHNGDGTAWNRWHGPSTPPVQLEPGSTVELAPWSGLLLNRQALGIVSSQQSGYFFTRDDYLLSCRLRSSGTRIIAVPGAKLLNGSSIDGSYMSPWRAYYRARNHVLFCRDVNGRLTVSDGAVVVRMWSKFFAGAVLRGEAAQAWAIVRGTVDGLLDRRGMVDIPT